MVELKGIQVTLPTRQVKETAKFFTQLLGFRIISQSASHMTLTHRHLRLSLMKAEPGFEPSAQPVHLRFTVETPQHIDEIAQRAGQFNIPLLEDVYDASVGSRTLACLGPDDNIIEIVVEPAPDEPATRARAAHPSGQQPGPVSQPSPQPSPSPTRTRADRYLLEAQAKLAKIKEELTRLSTAFSESDIAATLDEMRQRVARQVSELSEKLAAQIDQMTPEVKAIQQSDAERQRQETAMQEAERQRRRQEIEQALARYKQEVDQQYEEVIELEQVQEDNQSESKTLGPSDDDTRSGQ